MLLIPPLLNVLSSRISKANQNLTILFKMPFLASCLQGKVEGSELFLGRGKDVVRVAIEGDGAGGGM